MTVKNAKLMSDSDRLCAIRQALGFSQREMADEFGVVHGAVGLWETSKRKIPGPVLKLIELYESELGLKKETMPVLESLDKNWLSRTMKLTGTGAKAFGKIVFDNLRKMTKEDEEGNRIRLNTREAVARQIVKTFGSLKGLPHKLGQLMSYMDVDQPKEVRDIYAGLQHITPPMKASTIAEVIVDEFGQTPNQLFDSWEAEPFAAASIGQLHRAKAKGGRDVAVKVQYPGIREIVQADLKNASILDRLGAVMVRNHEPGTVLEEMTERFLDECDYTIEAKNQTMMRELHKDNPEIVVPEVFEELSSKRVITMEYFDVPRFQQFRDSASQKEKDIASGIMWDHAFVSAIKHGVFNADPHPGNYLFQKDAVVFLDYGCVKQIPRQLHKIWKGFLKAIADDNKDGVDDAIDKIGIVVDQKKFDYDRFYKLMRSWYYPCYCNKPYRFTRGFVGQQWKEMREWLPKNRYMRFPKELLFINQLQWGLYAVLADLDATNNWSVKFLPLLD